MTALEIHDFLKRIYSCDTEFEVFISNRKTKHRFGTYFRLKKRINLYMPLINLRKHDILETAIHEYAHHIHRTELQKDMFERTHGPEFWKIYSALMARAALKNLYQDDYAGYIILK